MKLLIVSDLHGNYEATKIMLESKWINEVQKIILLGDIIDYCPHSNEVIELLESFQNRIICNIWGNHEYAIINDEYDRFSSNRGIVSAKYTKGNLNQESVNYIKNVMHNDGIYEFEVDGKKCLAVHGSKEDIYWKAIKPEDKLKEYETYDYVFSGHSHISHFFTKFYDVDNPKKRNKKKTTFINPGSVGQPRNLCHLAQFCVLDTDTDEVTMVKISYDIEKEQEAFSNMIDVFYKERLEYGI